MPEARDPAIKLFGRTIPLPQGHPGGEPNPSLACVGADEVEDPCGETTKAEAEVTTSEIMEKPDHNGSDASSDLHCGNADESQATKQDERAVEDPIIEQEQNEANGCGQGKVLNKPDKVVSCPRCKSLNTKFCYYNNYNANQPRHFCKNCQRYWTAGGSMRNVPVGAGRRKTKHSAAHYRHMLISPDAISSSQLNTTESVNYPVHASGPPVAMMPIKNDGAAQNSATEGSMASVHNMNEQKRNAEGPASCGENGDEPSCASSLTALNGSKDEFPANAAHIEKNSLQGCCNGVNPMPHVQCYPGLPWACPWSPGWSSVAPTAAGRCSFGLMYEQENGNANPVPWNPPPIVAAPAFCAPTIPFPFIPAFFWGCISSWPNGTWNVPWVGPSCSSPPSSASNSGCSGLGKHYRDTSLPGEEKTEKSLWVPKTLRIDDPDEAAKSSIWATLGIKPDSTITKGGIFRGFQPKSEGGDHLSDGKQVLHANPAALSRSHAFQEST